MILLSLKMFLFSGTESGLKVIQITALFNNCCVIRKQETQTGRVQVCNLKVAADITNLKSRLDQGHIFEELSAENIIELISVGWYVNILLFQGNPWNFRKCFGFNPFYTNENPTTITLIDQQL